MYEVSCDEALGLLSPFIDGETTINEGEMVTSHITICSSCALVIKELQQTKTKLAMLPKITPRQNFFKDIQCKNKQSAMFCIGPVKLKVSSFNFRSSNFAFPTPNWKQWGGLAVSFLIIFFIFISLIGYLAPADYSADLNNEDEIHDNILSLHASYCQRQSLNNQTVWATISENNLNQQVEVEGEQQ